MVEFLQLPVIEAFASSIELILADSFVKFGSIIVFLYSMLPSFLKIVGNGGIFVRLLDQGLDPIFMYVISVAGKMMMFYILYLVGRFLWNMINKRKKKTGKQELLADNHWIHKYRYLVFVAVPWVGSVGELFMVYSGHKRVGFIRILPWILISEGIRYGINMLNILGQLELPNILT